MSMSGWNDLEKFSSNLKYVLQEADIDVSLDTSCFCQCDDADDIGYRCTSETVPVFRDLEKAYILGMTPGIHIRICGGVKEFLVHYKSEGLSYSFFTVHINVNEYRKYYDFTSTVFDFPWTALKNASNGTLTFIDHLIIAYLSGYSDPQKISAADINNAAGKRYISDLVCFGDLPENINFHNDINVLSSLPYEKQRNTGEMAILSAKYHSYMDICLLAPISLQEYKKARKLFEIAAQDILLAGNSRVIYGMVSRHSLRKIPAEKVCLLKIHGPIDWEVLCYDPKTDTYSTLVRYKDGLYRLKASDCQLDTFKNSIIELCPTADIEALLRIVQSAKEQKHGTTIVFSAEARKEAVRLKRACFQVKPTEISDTVCGLSAIDGAILCDMSGVCYAIGAILDGISAENEDISRGARHNSSKRYKAAHPECVIVVVSEDGGITIE